MLSLFSYKNSTDDFPAAVASSIAFGTSFLSSSFIYSLDKGFSLAISSTLSIDFSSSGSFGFSFISGSFESFSDSGISIGDLFGSAIFDGGLTGFIFLSIPAISPACSPISAAFEG